MLSSVVLRIERFPQRIIAAEFQMSTCTIAEQGRLAGEGGDGFDVNIKMESNARCMQRHSRTYTHTAARWTLNPT